MNSQAIEKVCANLGQIIGRVSKIDRTSKANEYTDLNDVWNVLYAVKADARAALRAIRRDDAKRQLYSYHVTVDYQTKGGRCSTWAGHVLAPSIYQAQEIAEGRIERRKSTLKIHGGSASPMP